MFNCQHCGQTVPPHTPAALITLEWREKNYRRREEFYPPFKQHKDELYPRPNPKARKKDWTPDPGGHGYEIARQIKVCPACAALLREQQPEAVSGSV